MCGIIGIWGMEGAARHARTALERLEYRGYDSSGVAWSTPEGIDVQKEVGRVAELPDIPDGAERLAIGHTRWATHGGVTKENAHPHVDGTGRFAIVHNGAIEGHIAIRKRLLAQGHVLRSETDSELLIHLYERARRTMGPLSALRAMLKGLTGSWSIVILDGEANALVFATHHTPLLVGEGDGVAFLASDATALVEHTRRIHYLEDGDHGLLDAKGIHIYNSKNKERRSKATMIDWDVAMAEKAGYAHFMLKEIHDAPTAINQCLAGRIDRQAKKIRLDLDDGLLKTKRIHLIGCGTSLHAAEMGKVFLEAWAGIPCQAESATEVVDRAIIPVQDTLYIALSQSGETFDTLAAVRRIKAAGGKVLAITNVQGSTMERAADSTLHLRVGPEIGVAASKTLLATATLLAALALDIGQRTGHKSQSALRALVDELGRLPRALESVLRSEAELAEMGGNLAKHRSLFFLGRGIHVATAREAALKFKEITYLHAEGMGAADLKHGPFALLEPDVPCVFFETGETGQIWSTVVEVQARGSPCHVICQAVPEEMVGGEDSVAVLAKTDPLLAAIPFSLAGQLVSYHAAARLERAIDRPRNLAKSITVA